VAPGARPENPLDAGNRPARQEIGPTVPRHAADPISTCWPGQNLASGQEGTRSRSLVACIESNRQDGDRLSAHDFRSTVRPWRFEQVRLPECCRSAGDRSGARALVFYGARQGERDRAAPAAERGAATCRDPASRPALASTDDTPRRAARASSRARMRDRGPHRPPAGGAKDRSAQIRHKTEVGRRESSTSSAADVAARGRRDGGHGEQAAPARAAARIEVQEMVEGIGDIGGSQDTHCSPMMVVGVGAGDPVELVKRVACRFLAGGDARCAQHDRGG